MSDDESTDGLAEGSSAWCRVVVLSLFAIRGFPAPRPTSSIVSFVEPSSFQPFSQPSNASRTSTVLSVWLEQR